jgi:acyl phosphate:glycerol-3-phosphate acyltransferase
MSPLSSLLTLLVGGLWHWPLLALGLGYLLGSIPFGLLLTRAAGRGDVRAIGSGNIGATNVLRTGSKPLAAGTLFLDGLKGAAAVLIADHLYGGGAALFAGLGAFLGHIYPVWLKFRGGKGVATFLGVVSAFSWMAGAVFAAVWLIVAAVTRYSSLAGLIATLAVPLAFYLRGHPEYAVLSAVMAVLMVWTHRGNIARLIKGTEAKIGAKG